ncbi:MAG: Maf family nucleotide pyrophosphatase [Steroidobacteraceae bacterium]|nr:Maf family nucleotide pyrophosphatase [Steroidobacteraceae bacterium]MDW8259642.1 Maf family protein [Gammaproteobacteria bacterium]
MSAAACPLILASTSRYRRELLQRLKRPFDCEAPEIDESHRPGEAPGERAARLARAKARAVATRHPEALVIGSDQVCALGEQILDKPGRLERQRAQLTLLAGRCAVFYTAVSVICAARDWSGEHLDITRCRFRPLSAQDIERYVRAEPALDCAGGFKIEGLGVSLLEAVETLDPTAVIGLPLIGLSGLLNAFDAQARS